MADVSSRNLRNHAADLLRRVEAGERLAINVNRRPVAELVPLGRPPELQDANALGVWRRVDGELTREALLA